MEKWQKISLILCTFGFFKELRPSEPFITEYIVDYKNVTSEELIHVAFPVSTYSSVVTLAVVFLITDLIRYRPVVIFEGLIYIVTWTLLILGNNLESIIWVEIFYGIACSTEVAYYTYIYSKVDKDHYKKVTSHTSSALYAGKFMGGLLAQIMVTFHLLNYHQLTYLTLAFSIFGFTATLFLPKVKSSIYFHRRIGRDEEEKEEDPEVINVQEDYEEYDASNTSVPTLRRKFSATSKIWDHFVMAYSNSYILKWSLWWALASAGQYQVVNYIQVLWEEINQENQLEPYNGVVKALHTLLSAVLCLAVGYVKLRWNQWGESLLGVISLVQGGLLVWMARSSYLYTAYICYTIFRTIHPVMLTIASAEVAHGISNDSHGLIFGINTFLALLLQTLLTLVVSDKKGLALDVKHQFLIYGAYFSVLGAIFVLVTAWSSASFIYQKIRATKTGITINQKSEQDDENETCNNLSCSSCKNNSHCVHCDACEENLLQQNIENK